MTVYRNAFHNGIMLHTCYKFESTIHINFVACVALMESIFPCFNLKPDDCNPAFSIHTFSITSNTHTGKALVGISLVGMRLMFDKMHPGPISDYDITEKNSM